MYSPKIYDPITGAKIYGELNGILGMTLKDKSNPILWMRNQRRLTTTDARSIDWFYCASQPGINPAFVPKSASWCAGPDQVGDHIFEQDFFNMNFLTQIKEKFFVKKFRVKHSKKLC